MKTRKNESVTWGQQLSIAAVTAAVNAGTPVLLKLLAQVLQTWLGG